MKDYIYILTLIFAQFCLRLPPLQKNNFPTLIQAVFHVGDRFWARENLRNIKKQFFSKISSIL